MNNSYIEFSWRPDHPNIIKKRDSDRVKKKKMNRWPPQKYRNIPLYAWFDCDDAGETPEFSLPAISLEELIENKFKK